MVVSSFLGGAGRAAGCALLQLNLFCFMLELTLIPLDYFYRYVLVCR